MPNDGSKGKLRAFQYAIVLVLLTLVKPVMARSLFCSDVFNSIKNPRLTAEEIGSDWSNLTPQQKKERFEISGIEQIREFFNKNGFEINLEKSTMGLYQLEPTRKHRKYEELNLFVQSGFSFYFSPGKGLNKDIQIDWKERVIFIDPKVDLNKYYLSGNHYTEHFLNFLQKTKDPNFNQTLANQFRQSNYPYPDMNYFIYDYIAFKNGISTRLEVSSFGKGIIIRPEGSHRLNRIAKALMRNYQTRLGWFSLDGASGFYSPDENLVSTDIRSITQGKITFTLIHELRHLSFEHAKRSNKKLYPWMAFLMKSEKQNLTNDSSLDSYREQFVGDEIIARLNQVNVISNRTRRSELALYLRQLSAKEESSTNLANLEREEQALREDLELNLRSIQLAKEQAKKLEDKIKDPPSWFPFKSYWRQRNEVRIQKIQELEAQEASVKRLMEKTNDILESLQSKKSVNLNRIDIILNFMNKLEFSDFPAESPEVYYLDGIRKFAAMTKNNIKNLLETNPRVEMTDKTLKIEGRDQSLVLRLPRKMATDDPKHLRLIAKEKMKVIMNLAAQVERLSISTVAKYIEIQKHISQGAEAAELRREYYMLLRELNEAIKNTESF